MTEHDVQPALPPTAPARPLVEIRNVSKTFAGTRALTSFNLDLEPGEIHVLVGANGSGKSTLIKVLSGFYSPDPGAGSVRVGGEELHFGSPAHSYSLGCRFVHQDLGLVSTLSVLDNLNLGHFPTWLGTISTHRCRESTRELLATVGLHLDPSMMVSELGPARRTGVALARAMRRDVDHPARLLILDEPTATLPPDEVDQLLDMVRSVAASGVAVLFVTHHMDEVERIADSVTVMRDGHVVARAPMRSTSRAAIVEMVAAGAVTEVERYPERSVTPSATPCLSVEGVVARAVRGVSFTAEKGEIVGLAGLTGSGRETVLSAIFGAIPLDAGRVMVGGTVVPPHRPDRAVALGIGYLPADRKLSGGIADFTARENLTLTHLSPFWSALRLRPKLERSAAAASFQKFEVRPTGAIEQKLANFSGGNQQKILFAKWTRREPSVLLVDEPTQGVDIGAKAQLHRQLLSMANAGLTIIVSSADLEELTTLCSRILVFRNGRISDTLTGSRITQSEITRCVLSAASYSPATREAYQ